MNRDTSKLFDVQWVAQCARRLRERWPHADPTSLEEAAIELWNDEELRAVQPVRAAEIWLRRGAVSAPLGELGNGRQDASFPDMNS